MPSTFLSLKAWSNVASNLTRTVIRCVDKIWTLWIIVVYYMDNSISNNIQSQDGNSRITSKNWKEKTTLAEISSSLKDFVRATD